MRTTSGRLIYTEVEYMEQAALSWAMGLVDSNPELIGMLQGMMF